MKGEGAEGVGMFLALLSSLLFLTITLFHAFPASFIVYRCAEGRLPRACTLKGHGVLNIFRQSLVTGTPLPLRRAALSK